jgi:hypothetical protein
MKSQSTLKKLEELESHYERLLAGVRSLIALENGQPLVEKKSNSRNGETPATTPFAQLTKGDAVTKILTEKGELHTSKLFSLMRRRKHPIKSKNSLTNLLSTDKRFGKRGKGVWALAQAQ